MATGVFSVRGHQTHASEVLLCVFHVLCCALLLIFCQFTQVVVAMFPCLRSFGVCLFCFRVSNLCFGFVALDLCLFYVCGKLSFLLQKSACGGRVGVGNRKSRRVESPWKIRNVSESNVCLFCCVSLAFVDPQPNKQTGKNTCPIQEVNQSGPPKGSRFQLMEATHKVVVLCLSCLGFFRFVQCLQLIEAHGNV